MQVIFGQVPPIGVPGPEHGLMGYLVGAIAVLILGAAGFFYSLIRWFQDALKEQRSDYMKALDDKRKEFTEALKEETAEFGRMLEKLAVVHAGEMKMHLDQMTAWRAENIAEAKSMRELMQLFLNKIAEAKARDEQDESKKRRQAP